MPQSVRPCVPLVSPLQLSKGAYVVYVKVCMEIHIYQSVWTYQLHASPYKSSVDLNLDSVHFIYRPKCDAPSNGELVLSQQAVPHGNFKKIQATPQLLDLKIKFSQKIDHISCNRLDIIFVPFEEATNFDLEVASDILCNQVNNFTRVKGGNMKLRCLQWILISAGCLYIL